MGRLWILFSAILSVTKGLGYKRYRSSDAVKKSFTTIIPFKNAPFFRFRFLSPSNSPTSFVTLQPIIVSESAYLLLVYLPYGLGIQPTHSVCNVLQILCSYTRAMGRFSDLVCYDIIITE